MTKPGLVGTLLIAAFAFAGRADAHPFHVSTAECAFNADTGKIEVAIRVWPVDLERGLSRMLGHAVDLSTEPDLDAKLARYVDTHFAIRRPASTDPAKADAAATRLLWTWVGKEIGNAECWLYVEMPIPAETAGLTITDSLFFEHSRDQVNTIVLKRDGRTSSIVTKVGQATQPLAHPVAPGE